jgi:hypothetical protein
MRTVDRQTQRRERPVLISNSDKVGRDIEKYAAVLRKDSRFDLEVPETISPVVFKGRIKARAIVEARKELASNPNVKSVAEVFSEDSFVN